MENCERDENKTDVKKTEGCLERTSLVLTVDDVYEIAKLIGSEVEKLIDGFGKESAVGLVPKIVKVLELLESFASRNHVLKSREDELVKAFETFQAQQQQKKRNVKEEDCNRNEIRVEVGLQQKEVCWRRRCEELEVKVQLLQEESQELQGRLRGSNAQEERGQEREVMLKLKQVVDKQRDELRAKVQEISSVSKEVEALQEQLERFMKMNAELRHKATVMQTQMKSCVERKADMEADLRQKEKEIHVLRSQLGQANAANAGGPSTRRDLTDRTVVELKDPHRPCFTKQEVRDMLSERNELKANLFLVQEELAYYQREILNDERCPGFLLDAVRSAIKKQRTVIKAKMLGIPVCDVSSDEEERVSLFGGRSETEPDGAEEKPPESRIRSLFGFLTRSGSGGHGPSSHPGATAGSSSSSSWEIIVPEDDDDDAPAET